LLAEVEFGRGLANFAVAQFLDAQSRMFEGVKFQFSTSGGQGNFKLQLNRNAGVPPAPPSPNP
ncbi:MAG: hypothetical protein RLZZ458_2314, partial [Planctomycetota bacterium]